MKALITGASLLGGALISANDGSSGQVLLVRTTEYTCALNLVHVVEIMRLGPILPVAGALEPILGLSMIRGAPVPVVNFAAVFGASAGFPKRLVVVRTGERRVALAVDEVLGIHDLPRLALTDLPPLLRRAGAGAIDQIGALDMQLLFVLNSARVVPEQLWASLELQGL